MRRLFAAVFAPVLTLTLGAGVASADLVYNLVDVTFDDGATATGTFKTDDALTTLLDWDITTSVGSLPGFHFDTVNAPVNFSSIPNIIVLEDATPTHILELTFATPLTAAGALLLVNSPNDSFEQQGDGKRVVVAGSVSAVPEPSSLVLAAVGGLGALGYARRRRRRA